MINCMRVVLCFFGEAEHICFPFYVDRRKVTINRYRGSLYVDLREYYSTNKKGATGTGEGLAPTQRGISLTGEQWEKIVAAIPDLEIALSRL
jgi:hypothetical protein